MTAMAYEPTIEQYMEQAQAVPPGPWRLHGNCRGIHDEMYPSDGRGVREAKDICFGTSPILTHDGEDPPHPCPVRHECAAYAIAIHEPFGIWGGLSERERRRIQRKHDWRADDGAIRHAQAEADRQQTTALAKGVRPRSEGSSQRRVRVGWSGDPLSGAEPDQWEPED